MKTMMLIRKKENPVDFDRLYWLTSIKKCKSDMRAHIMYIYSDNGVLVNTDGSRIHSVVPEFFDLDDGFYEVVKRNKSEIALTLAMTAEDGPEYPAWETIFENGGRIARFKSVQWIYSATGHSQSVGFSDLIRYIVDLEKKDEKFCVNVDFLKDIVDVENGIDHIEHENPKASGPFFFADNVESPNMLAALMPMYGRR